MNKKNIDKDEIKKFNRIASRWWDVNGDFGPLHKINPLRLDFVSKNIKLENKQVLDIGCGGGLLSEPMSRLGANVTGIDPSEKNIKIAKLHSIKNKLKINYICSSPEKINIKKKYDIILNMEVVEHVENINFFIKKSYH